MKKWNKLKKIKAFLAIVLVWSMVFPYFPSPLEQVEANTTDWAAMWNITQGSWNKTTEGDETILTGSSSSETSKLVYNQDRTGTKEVKLDIKDGVESGYAGIQIYPEQGNVISVFYQLEDIYLQVNGLTQQQIDITPEHSIGEWYHLSVKWESNVIKVSYNNKEVITYDYSSNGTIGTPTKLELFTLAARKAGFKNVEVVTGNIESDAEDSWDTSMWNIMQGSWTKTNENGETILTAAASGVNKLVYNSSNLTGTYEIGADLRQNVATTGAENIGLQIYPSDGAVISVLYRNNHAILQVDGQNKVEKQLTTPPTVDEWYHLSATWEENTVKVLYNGEELISYDYSSHGTIGTPTKLEFYTDAKAASIKNPEVKQITLPEDDWDTSMWSITQGSWNETTENGVTVLTAPSTGVNKLMYNNWNLMGAYEIGADLRQNVNTTGGENIGLQIHPSNGAVVSVLYRNNHMILQVDGINRVEKQLSTPPELDEWYHLSASWDGNTVKAFYNDVEMISYDYSSHGTIGIPTQLEFYTDAKAASLKNPEVKLNAVSLDVWDTTEWKETTENNETVYTATSDNQSMKYYGDLSEVNSLEFDMRYNSYADTNANSGVSLYTNTNHRWYIDYRADKNAVRIRSIKDGSESYTTYTYLEETPKADEWMHWQIIWNDGTFYVKVDEELLLEQKITNGETIAAISLNEWLQPMSVKNMMFSKVKPSAWNYVNLEFKEEYDVEAFNVVGGDKTFEDGQMIVNLTEGGAELESPKIDVMAGSPYSMFLPVRNTLCVRLKNNTSADEITVQIVSDMHTEYGVVSKTFEIEPNSDYKTYFFNLPDVIEMGSAAEVFQYTSDVTDSEGYLHGFKFVLPKNVKEGTIAIDAVTFEREDPVYNYAGEISSCIADKEADTITIKGKVSPVYAGKKVTVYESAVNNYSESMTYAKKAGSVAYPREIEELGSGIVIKNGEFTVEIPFYNGAVTRLSSLFLAYVDGIKVSSHFSVENFRDFYAEEYVEVPELTVDVTSSQFGAKGDAFTCDDDAINAAIEYVNAQGGGVVVVPGDTSTQYGRRYIVTNIRLMSNVELRIEEGAILWQSSRLEDYDYTNNEFLDSPVYGHDNNREGIVWAHAINDNLPLVQITGTVDKYTENVRITGGGTIRMMDAGGEQPDVHNYGWDSNITVGCSSRIHLQPIGAWRVKNLDVVDITISRTNSYHVAVMCSEDIYFENCTLEEGACINSDGFGVRNSTNFTVNRCFAYGNDDIVTIVSKLGDLRDHVWKWEISDQDNSTRNVKVISSQLLGGHGVTFLPWGSSSEDYSKVLIKDVYVYDNVLGGESTGIGSWGDNPFYGESYLYNFTMMEKNDYTPVQDVTVINNRLMDHMSMDCGLTITNLYMEGNTYDGKELTYDVSMATQFIYGDFDKVIRSTIEEGGFKDESDWVVGTSNWTESLGNNGSVGTEKVREDLKYSGYIKGDGELYQGLYLISGTYEFNIKVNAVSGTSSVFVADRTGKIIAEVPVEQNTDFEEIVLEFTAEKSKLYHLGVKHEGAKDEIVYLDDAVIERTKGYSSGIDSDLFRTATYPFTEESEADDFKFYSSSDGGFQIQDGQLVPNGESGEFKAIVQGNNRVYKSVSVDIYPDENGDIVGGLYVNASQIGNAQAAINALSVMVESNFEGWSDAGNRVDIVVGSFPKWTELSRTISETGKGNNLFTNGKKEPLNLKVDINGNELIITVSLISDPNKYVMAVYEYAETDEEYGLATGKVGVRSMHSSSNFDNLNIVYTELPPEEDDNNYDKATYDFNSVWDAIDFDFYHSSNGGFNIKDGKLITTGEQGEFKAVLKSDERSYKSVSVDIYPDADGTINSGIYLSASNAGHAVDNINALGILVQSDFVDTDGTWIDAENRVDIIVGTFPKWKELSRTICETGEGNALFVNGKKEPLNLRVDIDGNKLTITLSLVSDPDCYVQTVYEYDGNYDLGYGAVGVRSMFDVASFDNFNVEYVGGVANGNGIPVVKPNANGSASGSGSSSSVDTGDNAGSTILMMAAMAVVSFGAILFILGKKRRA